MLRLVTFNLLSASHETERWQSRLENAVQVLLQLNADVIGLQECERRQLDGLRKHLTNYDLLAKPVATPDGDHNLILYRRSRLRLIQESCFWLSESPQKPGSLAEGAMFPRLLISAEFVDLTHGNHFFVLNTHLDYASASARMLSAALIEDHIQNLGSDIPLFLLADFNDRAETSRLYQKLVGDLALVDTLSLCDRGGPTFFGQGECHGQRIDWILYRGDVELLESGIVDCGRPSAYASDHSAVYADVRWTGTP